MFLDANVLYAACLAPAGGCAKLWTAPSVDLVTSDYAVREVWENLQYEAEPAHFRARLHDLLDHVHVVPDQPARPESERG